MNSVQAEVELGAVAKGGSCVARLGESGRVVFVRGGIPGEIVRIEVTDASRAAWWRGRVTEVIQASADRVVPPCPVADRCGGCDWQHIALDRQRALKAELVAGQLRHLAGVDARLDVKAVTGDEDGLAWRTRMRYLIAGGTIGLRAPFSHDVVPVPASGCPLAVSGGPGPQALTTLAGTDGEIAVTIAESGVTVWSSRRGILSGDAVVTQRAAGRAYRVRADGFWQVHPGAADALAHAVVEALQPGPGETALDLYCGAGLFAGVLDDAGALVFGVDDNRAAVALARRNVPNASFIDGRVEKAPWPPDDGTNVGLVVLDPPRSGAGASVVRRVAAAGPRAVAYVACDEASLARDVAVFAACGYELTDLKAFDIFPMTSHVECVARLTPVKIGPGS